MFSRGTTGFEVLGLLLFPLFWEVAPNMEEVEEANKAAVRSCHRVLSLLSQSQDQSHWRDLTMETGEGVFQFKRVISLLNKRLGHPRIRKLESLQHVPLPQSILLESPITTANYPVKNLHFLSSSNFTEKSFQELYLHPKSSIFPALELSSTSGKSPLQLAQLQQGPTASAHLQLLQQQKLQQMLRNSNSGISLNFDSSSCTPTMSSNRSFISSLSVDGSVADIDASAFNLIGAIRTSDQNSQHKRKCSGRGEDGSFKCSSSSRCHCSKKRLGLFH